MASYANHGRTFLNGYPIIIAHSHAHDVERGIFRHYARLHFSEHPDNSLKLLSYLCLIVGIIAEQNEKATLF